MIPRKSSAKSARPSRASALLGVLAGLMATGGAAVAYFNSTGSGSSAGTVAVTKTIVLGAATPGAATLVPGGNGSLAVTLQNTGSTALRVKSLVLDTAAGTSGYSSNAATCLVSYTAQDNGGAGWDVAKGATATVTLTDAVSMGAASLDSCQGQTFTVHLKTT